MCQRILATLLVFCLGSIEASDSSLSTATEVKPVEKSRKVIVTQFQSPFRDKKWEVNSYKFGEVCEYETESGGKKNWGRHLGEDCNVKAGTSVYPIAPGKIAYIGQHPGTSKDKRNWGGIVILGHWISNTEALYSLHGHLRLNEDLKRGQMVTTDDKLGTVAASLTPQNGWWEDAHLHLQVCLDPDDLYRGGVLRGYAHDKAPNRLEDHIAPSELFRRFKAGTTIKQLMK
jgi:murein DD-endopeptidase MepM/ murein hydrolase activator NlpD